MHGSKAVVAAVKRNYKGGEMSLLGVDLKISVRAQHTGGDRIHWGTCTLLANNIFTCNRGEVPTLAAPERAPSSSVSHAGCYFSTLRYRSSINMLRNKINMSFYIISEMERRKKLC